MEPVHGKWYAVFNIGEISCLGQELSNFVTSPFDSSRHIVIVFLSESWLHVNFKLSLWFLFFTCSKYMPIWILLLFYYNILMLYCKYLPLKVGPLIEFPLLSPVKQYFSLYSSCHSFQSLSISSIEIMLLQ